MGYEKGWDMVSKTNEDKVGQIVEKGTNTGRWVEPKERSISIKPQGTICTGRPSRERARDLKERRDRDQRDARNNIRDWQNQWTPFCFEPPRKEMSNQEKVEVGKKDLIGED